MGGGSFDNATYTKAKTTRAATGTPDFDYTTTAARTRQTHPNLDPARIAGKPFKKLESRDSTEHPESNAIIVSLDVTGSNVARAADAQKALPKLMTLLSKYIADPQIAFAANDDYKAQGGAAGTLQISDFESDNRIDEHLRNLWLVSNGGGNDGESYDLVLYAAARKTVIDCYEKRGRKGYLFLYADEPVFNKVLKTEVAAVFGDKLQGDISIREIIEDVQQQYHLFFIWPHGGYDHALRQYKDLVGEEYVLELQHPNMICELIASTIGMLEKGLSHDDAVHDLVVAGTSKHEADSIVRTSMSRVPKTASGKMERGVGAGASRL